MKAQTFSAELNVLCAAAVPIVFVRTREPIRAQHTIRQFVFTQQGDFYVWNRVDGTILFPAQDFESRGERFSEDTIGSAQMALDLVASTENKTGRRQFWSMMYPHWELPDMPAMIQSIVNYSTLFINPEIEKTLILIVPETFTPPVELTDCVTILDFDIPDHEELIHIVENMFEMQDESVRPNLDESDYSLLAGACAGMTSQAAEDAVCRIMTGTQALFPEIDVPEFARRISEIKAEVIRKSEVLEIMQSVDMSEVGGLEELKEYISDRATAFTPAARAFGVDRPLGIALIGPPGTGKTLGAKAVAHELKRPLVKLDIARVFDGLVGGSEKKMAGALKMLSAMAPCVCLIDEVDKAFNMNSGGGDSGVGMRVLGMVLTHLQESADDIYWIMTANRTEGLPPELLRKGRLDEVFAVSVPNPSERAAILAIHLRTRNQDPANVADLEAAITASDGFVPSEIMGAVKEAVTQAFTKGKPVTGGLIAEQLGKTRKLAEAFKDQFEAMETWAANNARPASREPRKSTRERTRAATPPVTPGSTARARPRPINPGGDISSDFG